MQELHDLILAFKTFNKNVLKSTENLSYTRKTLERIYIRQKEKSKSLLKGDE